MNIHDVSEYVQLSLPKPEFYIQDLLTKEGSMIVYGGVGVRKSWLVMYLAYCLATGSDWLGFTVTQARTLLINVEVASSVYFWRLKPMSLLFSMEQGTLFESSPGMMFLEDKTYFENFYNEVANIKPEVLILDCFQSCFGGNENATEEVSPFLMNMSKLQHELHTAIVLVHHSNKNPLAVSMDKMRGTTKLPGWTDSVLYLVEQPSGSQLQFGKTRNSMHELHNLNIEFKGYNWSTRK